MKRAAFLILVSFWLPSLAFCDAITITAPNIYVDRTAGNGSFTLSATGSADLVAGYGYDVALVPDPGAHGLTFTDGAPASSDYVFFGQTVLPSWATVDTTTDWESRRIVGGHELSPTYPVHKEISFSGPKNLATLYFDIASDAYGTYTVQLDPIAPGQTDFFDRFGNSPGAGTVNGSITINAVPEPSTIALLGGVLLGAPVLVWRRMRKATAVPLR